MTVCETYQKTRNFKEGENFRFEVFHCVQTRDVTENFVRTTKQFDISGVFESNAIFFIK